MAALVRQFCISDLEKGYDDSREGAQDVHRAIMEIQAKDGSILNTIGEVFVCVCGFALLLKQTSIYFCRLLTIPAIVTTAY